MAHRSRAGTVLKASASLPSGYHTDLLDIDGLHHHIDVATDEVDGVVDQVHARRHAFLSAATVEEEESLSARRHAFLESASEHDASASAKNSKRERRAERIMEHYQDFMDSEMFEEAASLLEVSNHQLGSTRRGAVLDIPFLIKTARDRAAAQAAMEAAAKAAPLRAAIAQQRVATAQATADAAVHDAEHSELAAEHAAVEDQIAALTGRRARHGTVMLSQAAPSVQDLQDEDEAHRRRHAFLAGGF